MMKRLLTTLTTGLVVNLAQAKPVESRLEDPRIKQAIMGSLLRLDDTQIKERSGRHDPLYDACSGDGCKKKLPGGPGVLPLPLPFTNNLAGEWANLIHIFPKAHAPWQPPGEAIVQIQDSNLFMVATTLYPLYLLDEGNLPQEKQIITKLRNFGLKNIASYRREQAYSFWPVLPGSSSAAPRVGPLNIPMVFGHGQYLAQIIPSAARRRESPHFNDWSTDLFNKDLNPHGVDALANIPNDADDTALAILTHALATTFDQVPPLDSAPLEQMLLWRDKDRTKGDHRDDWKTDDSGGFLTWLKDEDLSKELRFKSPETGVIPLGVNNVDCVVNANVLTAFGLSGYQDHPAVHEASELLAIAAEKRAWPECGLYYPQKMMFPYAVSRAYRDGGVRTPALKQAMRRILLDLIKDQKDLSKASPRLKGAFPGGADLTYDLSTALAVTTLLNIGRDIASEAFALKDYENALEGGISYLLNHQKSVNLHFNDTFARGRLAKPSDDARYWHSGLFFSASKWSLAQWRSEAYTNAMVLEALSKYVIGWDLGSETISQAKRLKITSYSNNASDAASHFTFKL